MKRFKNIRYFFLLFCACWSMVCGMEEDHQVVELTSRVEKLNISEHQDPDQSAYFFKEDDKLYRKLFVANLELEDKSDVSSLIKIIKEEDVTLDQKRTAFACALNNFKMQSKIVKAFLKTGLNLNFYFYHKDKKDSKDKENFEPDEYYLTPLIYAVKEMDLASVKLLLNEGADIDLASPYNDGEYSNMTPLMWAANIGDLERVEFLGVKRGANPNIAQSKYARGDAGMTPLHCAVNWNEQKIVQSLLKCKGINVNTAQPIEAGRYYGQTPFHSACKIGMYDLVKMLFDAGADITKTLSFRGKTGMTPLFSAIKGGKVANVKLLLENGADVNQAQPNTAGKNSGQTPLHFACSYGYFDIIDLLLDAGAQVHVAQTKFACCNAGMTALHWAAYSGSVKAINSLVDDYKADVNAALYAQARKDAGRTPLHFAVVNDDTESVRALLKYEKINVNAKQLACAGVNAGYTPLHHACKRGFFKVAALLIENKANVDAMLKRREDDVYYEASPLTVALLSSHNDYKQKKELASLLLNKGAVVRKIDLKITIEKGCNAILEKLLNNYAADLEMLEDLANIANFYKNSGALNLIKNKKLQINMLKTKTQNTNNKQRKKRRRKRKKKKRNKPLNSSSRISQEGAEDDEEEELEEAVQEISINNHGKICVKVLEKEGIKVLEDSKAQHKIEYSDLTSFGGKVLTIIVKKLKKPQEWLHELSRFGYDESKRVLRGSRKNLESPKPQKKKQPIEKWCNDPETLKNPKMNNPKDPTHAFPRYVEKNYCRWATSCYEEDVAEYDKRDLPRGKKKSDYIKKLLIYIPGTIEIAKDGGFGTERIVGFFEIFILVPTGAISKDNRPLCVHRFFRPCK